MATVILRPTGDVSNNFSLSSGSSAYLMVNESTADEDSTRLYYSTTSTSAATKSATFTLDKSVIPTGATINSIKAVVRLKSSGTLVSTQVKVGTSTASITDSGSSSYSDLSANIPTSADLSTMGITISFKSTSSKSTQTVAITQVYLEVNYTAPEGTKSLTVNYNNGNIISAEVVGDVSAIYDGKTIVTLSLGTKTLNCSGKVMKTNVTINGKTIECKDKLMRSNIIITLE